MSSAAGGNRKLAIPFWPLFEAPHTGELIVFESSSFLRAEEEQQQPGSSSSGRVEGAVGNSNTKQMRGAMSADGTGRERGRGHGTVTPHLAALLAPFFVLERRPLLPLPPPLLEKK
ncbi:hypothetical protein SRHO_G00200590 [Serrasalmus rhombeus]